MSERLDRIEAILEATTQKQAENAAQISQNAEGIDTLLGAVSTYEAEARKLHNDVLAITNKSKYNEQLFEIIRSEAQADREETRRLWNDTVNQMERDRAEATKRFDAQQEVIQRLLVELVEMNRDNRRLRDRIDTLEGAA